MYMPTSMTRSQQEEQNGRVEMSTWDKEDTWMGEIGRHHFRKEKEVPLLNQWRPNNGPHGSIAKRTPDT